MVEIALILAGGSGTRLWPISRKSMPKQLLALTGNHTLLQETCRRIAPVIAANKQWIITGKDHYFKVVSQVKELAQESEDARENIIEVLEEPIGKNTAPAIFWAAVRCLNLYGENSILVVLPSDHLITKEIAYLEAIKAGIEKAKNGALVTLGIRPVYPETGYGYIEILEKKPLLNAAYKVISFREKPDYNKASEYLGKGNYLWNSGMFIFHVGTLLEEAKKYCPDICGPFIDAELGDREEVINAYNRTLSQSIDYALMEHTSKAYVIPAEFGWNDVGSWKNFFEINPKDENGNVIHGEHITIDTEDSLIYSNDRLVATIGLKDIAIIDTLDALMVCPLEQTQRVREIIDLLKQRGKKIHLEHRTVERPWGEYSVLMEGPGYKIKKIVVSPHQKLSMQMHHHRSEHWIVMRGTAKITNGNKEIYIQENESTFIPKVTRHCLENPGLIPLEIIEAQCGSYLEEDDIVRFDDIYGREITENCRPDFKE